MNGGTWALGSGERERERERERGGGGGVPRVSTIKFVEKKKTF